MFYDDKEYGSEQIHTDIDALIAKHESMFGKSEPDIRTSSNRALVEQLLAVVKEQNQKIDNMQSQMSKMMDLLKKTYNQRNKTGLEI